MLSSMFLIVVAMASLAVAAPAPTSSNTPPVFVPGKSATYHKTSEGNVLGSGAHSVPNTTSAKHSLIQAFALGGVGSYVTGGGLNWYNGDIYNAGTSGYADPNFYTCYRGIKEGFPGTDRWMNFIKAFERNQFTTMVNYDTGEEQGQIWNTIVQVSQEAKVDARLILAVIMQESSGNVWVGCTNNGIVNCGLMQAYTGSVGYNPNNMAGSILQMVRDGTQGTTQGPGLVQWISQNDWTAYAGNTEGNVFQAARGYNSGSINFADLSDPRGATDSYVSDLANRLQGWNGNSCGNNYWLACNWQTAQWC